MEDQQVTEVKVKSLVGGPFILAYNLEENWTQDEEKENGTMLEEVCRQENADTQNAVNLYPHV